MKTTAFADCRRFSQSVIAAGGKIPERMQNLIRAYDTLANSTPPTGVVPSPSAPIVDACLDGSLTEAKLAELLPAAAAAAQVIEYRKQLTGDTARVLLQAWHREMERGGADAILSSLRPAFDRHAKEIAKARALFTSESDAEFVLAGGEPGTIEAWQGLQAHITAVGKIVMVAREFGCKLSAMFSQVTELVSAENFRLSDEALMCCDGNILQESRYFSQPDRGHRTSPLFKAVLRLHSIESARARYANWAAAQWDSLHGARPQGGWIDEQGTFHEHPRPTNPFREGANA